MPGPPQWVSAVASFLPTNDVDVTADVNGPPDDVRGAVDLCALGRIRTCNLLIRSQMLYPLSYECLAFRAFWGPSALREQHYMTCGVT